MMNEVGMQVGRAGERRGGSSEGTRGGWGAGVWGCSLIAASLARSLRSADGLFRNRKSGRVDSCSCIVFPDESFHRRSCTDRLRSRWMTCRSAPLHGDGLASKSLLATRLVCAHVISRVEMPMSASCLRIIRFRKRAFFSGSTGHVERCGRSYQSWSAK